MNRRQFNVYPVQRVSTLFTPSRSVHLGLAQLLDLFKAKCTCIQETLGGSKPVCLYHLQRKFETQSSQMLERCKYIRLSKTDMKSLLFPQCNHVSKQCVEIATQGKTCPAFFTHTIKYRGYRMIKGYSCEDDNVSLPHSS